MTTRISQAGATTQDEARCWSSRAGSPSTARKPPPKWRTPGRRQGQNWCRQAGEMVRTGASRPRPENAAAGALQRSDAVGPWKARASSSRRRVREAMQEKGWHAGHARVDHRRPDHESTCCARPRADPTAKSFQLMTLLRGWRGGMSKPELTGDGNTTGAVEHGSSPARSHAGDRRDEKAHRHEGQG